MTVHQPSTVITDASKAERIQRLIESLKHPQLVRVINSFTAAIDFHKKIGTANTAIAALTMVTLLRKDCSEKAFLHSRISEKLTDSSTYLALRQKLADLGGVDLSEISPKSLLIEPGMQQVYDKTLGTLAEALVTQDVVTPLYDAQNKRSRAYGTHVAFLENIGIDDTLLNLDSEAEIDDAILTLVEGIAQQSD